MVLLQTNDDAEALSDEVRQELRAFADKVDTLCVDPRLRHSHPPCFVCVLVGSTRRWLLSVVRHAQTNHTSIRRSIESKYNKMLVALFICLTNI